MPRLFEPLTLRGVTLKNRIVMSPMCQYSAGSDGIPNDWHYVHYPTRAVGGVGLVMVEATAVESGGRLSLGDLGIYSDSQIEPLARLAHLCHRNGAKVGIQLAHAGRKAWTDDKGFGPGRLVGPSALPFDEGWNEPCALAAGELEQIVLAFNQAARRAHQAGFDVIEVHAAHGYLVSSFLSPMANHRQDEYGGSLDNRSRLLYRVVAAIREVWPEGAPLFVRVSASDWVPGGVDVDEMVQVAKNLKARGVDLIDCSSGGVVPAMIPAGPGYQVPFAQRIRAAAGIATAAVGIITTAELADEIIRNGRADLVAVGRELLRHPYWPLDAAAQLKVDIEWPVQYRAGRR